LSPEQLCEFGAQVAVHHGQQRGHHLDDVYFAPEAIENIAELAADGSATEDDELLRNERRVYGSRWSPWRG
jgi:hypothetical protein